MKKKEWKQRCAQLEDHVIEVVAQARSWRKKYFSAIRETVSLKKNILNKHIQCSNLSGNVVQLREAAEFEARVAKKLAKTNWITGCNSNCPWSRMNPKDSDNCVHGLSFGFCELRNARLEVEEEMDG